MVYFILFFIKKKLQVYEWLIFGSFLPCGTSLSRKLVKLLISSCGTDLHPISWQNNKCIFAGFLWTVERKQEGIFL